MASVAVMPKRQVPVQDKGVDLAKSTVALVVAFGLPGNSKKLKASQYEVDADKEMTKAQKILLDSKELRDIANADGNFRTFLDNYTLDFPSRAVKLVPLAKVLEVDEACREHENNRRELVAIFMAAYPTLCLNAEKRLGGIYNPKDYPDAELILNKFFFRYQFVSMGVPGQLKELSKKIYRNEQDKAKQVLSEAVDEIIQLRRAAFQKLVDHLRSKLDASDGKQKIFRDSTVEKLQEFIKEFDIYNVAGDEEGKKLAEQANKLLGGLDPASLREVDTTREKVLAGLDKIGEQLSKLVEDKPSRKFRAVAAELNPYE